VATWRKKGLLSKRSHTKSRKRSETIKKAALELAQEHGVCGPPGVGYHMYLPGSKAALHPHPTPNLDCLLLLDGEGTTERVCNQNMM
jgi:hypothetical protein